MSRPSNASEACPSCAGRALPLTSLLSPKGWRRTRHATAARRLSGANDWIPVRSDRSDREGKERKSIPATPDSAVMFRGAGSNIIYIDRENDLVVVVRWIRGGYNDFIAKVLESIETGGATQY